MNTTTIPRKFLNIDAPTESVPQAATSIASMMAQHGVKSEPGMTVEIPSISPVTNTTENKEQNTLTAQEPPTAKVEQTPNAEKVSPETPTPQVEQPKVEVPQQIVETPQAAPTWQEVLKQQQPETVYKELGLDASVVNLAKEIATNQQMIGFYQHWKNNGNVNDYLRELSTDYSKMPAEEVMRHQLRTEYPKATDKQIEVLFQKEVIQAYNLDSEDEQELETGKLLLDAKADRYRDAFVQNQQKYLVPKPPEPSQPTPNPYEEAEKVKQQETEAFKSYIDNNQYTKSIFASKQFVLGEGDEAFKFPIDPQRLRDNLVDADRWATKLFIESKKPDGSEMYEPDVTKQYLISMIAEYGMDFMNAYASHYKTLGGKATIAPIENASQSDGSQPAKTDVAPKTAAEAMARYGTLR